MPTGIFEAREHAFEATYFHQQDSKLLDAIRRNASFDEIAEALAEKLAIDNKDLLLRLRDIGITPDIATALLLAPLVQVAWADGAVNRRAREAVTAAALERGISVGSPSYKQLLDWLHVRPAEAVFECALDVLRYGLAVLTAAEKEERIGRIIKACLDVGNASGNRLSMKLGLTSRLTAAKRATIASIAERLRTPQATANARHRAV